MAAVNELMDNQFIKDFKELDSTVQKLINSAIEVRKNAYCPYSKFPVGAAVLTSTGDIYTGCNIENSSLGATICAERVALTKAISDGHRNFTACAVTAYKEDQFVYPCGICRQFLAEFTNPRDDLQLYLVKPSSSPLRVVCTSVKQIIPFMFSLGSSDYSQSLHLND